jgi:hypothetical protein
MVLDMNRCNLWLLTALLVLAVACQRSEAGKAGAGAAASSSAGKLDAMQLSSARRVALESAAAAMQHRDLGRLKQLDLWVKNRAQVAIFEADDLRSLELAITCLEHVPPPPEALGQLEQLKSGSLRSPARALCGGALAQ